VWNAAGDDAQRATSTKLEVADPASSDAVATTALGVDTPRRRCDHSRESTSGEPEVVGPEAAGARSGGARRRASRVVWPSSAAAAAAAAESTAPGSGATSPGAGGGGGKVHRCAECRRTFSRSDMLERHARLHTGIRPYACRLCTQVCSRIWLRVHTASVGGGDSRGYGDCDESPSACGDSVGIFEWT